MLDGQDHVDTSIRSSHACLILARQSTQHGFKTSLMQIAMHGKHTKETTNPPQTNSPPSTYILPLKPHSKAAHTNHLSLPLLLSRHNLKSRRPILLPPSPSAGRTLLSHLAPPPTCPASTTRPQTLAPSLASGSGSRSRHHPPPILLPHPLIRQFTSADEFLCEASAVEGLRVGVDGVGYYFCFRGEEEEGLDEVVDWIEQKGRVSNQSSRMKGKA